MQKLKAMDVIDEIMTTIELKQVTKSQMWVDIHRMVFKIKPVSGDIALFERIQAFFLKPLWKMGRADEIVQKYLYNLSGEEQEVLFDFLEEFEYKTQLDFNHQLIKKSLHHSIPKTPLKLEVFKDGANTPKLIN